MVSIRSELIQLNIWEKTFIGFYLMFYCTQAYSTWLRLHGSKALRLLQRWGIVAAKFNSDWHQLENVSPQRALHHKLPDVQILYSDLNRMLKPHSPIPGSRPSSPAFLPRTRIHFWSAILEFSQVRLAQYETLFFCGQFAELRIKDLREVEYDTLLSTDAYQIFSLS